jgi:hypothetical protein
MRRMTSGGFHIQRLKIEEPARRRRWQIAVISALTALASLPILYAAVQEERAKFAAQEAYWTVAGRPCQPLDAARFKGVSSPPSVTLYSGVIYQRHGGGMTCRHRTDKIGGVAMRYPVCKFSSPDYLGVVANGQERFYDLTMGRAASTSVIDGEIRCVETAKFEM